MSLVLILMLDLEDSMKQSNSFLPSHQQLLQGMYKSTLVCPDCNFSSVTMDTFNCLSLPLPSAKMRTIEVTVVTMDGSQPPTQYALEVLKLGESFSDCILGQAGYGWLRQHRTHCVMARSGSRFESVKSAIELVSSHCIHADPINLHFAPYL